MHPFSNVADIWHRTGVVGDDRAEKNAWIWACLSCVCDESWIILLPKIWILLHFGVFLNHTISSQYQINQRVTQRMPRLQITSAIGNMSRRCQQHFYPTSAQSPAIGYLPLSIGRMSGLFIIGAILATVSAILLFVEILFSHFHRQNENTELVKIEELQPQVIHIEFVLKNDQHSIDIMNRLHNFLLTNQATVLSSRDSYE